MKRNRRITDQRGIYFITTTVVGWIDVFTRKQLAAVVIESLAYCQREKGLIIYAWCLMPNHLHMIVSARDSNLSDIMRDFKKFTAKKVISTIQIIKESREWMVDKFQFAAKINFKSDKYKFWLDGFYPILVDSSYLKHQKLNYVHQNPVKAGYVTSPEHYAYSSAVDYYTAKKGMLEVVRL